VKPDQDIKKFFRHNIVLTPALSEKDDKGKMIAVISLAKGITFPNTSGKQLA